MKLTRLLLFASGLVLISVSGAYAQSGGVGGSQSQSTQTFPGSSPAPSTDATPAQAKAEGTVPATTPASKQGATGNSAPTSTASTPSSTPKSSGAGTMSPIVVTAQAEGSILPNDQTVTSVFGTDLSVQDTPRAVTVVSSQLLSDANISDLADFVKVAPSAYTTDQFGVASVPNIRGQEAEVFINGMQRTTRGDGPPTSFNSVDQADVVEGPASSILGPTANTGGYVNFVTKQPYFDAFHSDTEFTYGSYDEKIWTEDFGGPISKDLAYRVSYQGDYSGSYYNNEKTNSNDGYIALSWTPTKDFRIDFNSEIYDGRYNENTGLNRPTQGLIDGLQYSTGGTTPFGGTAAGGSGVAGPASPTNPGSFGGVIDSPGTVTISKQATLVSPSDSDFGKDVNAELTETYNASDDLTFINHTYYEFYDERNTELAQLYTQLQMSNIVQDRFETHITFDTPIGNDTKIENDAKDDKDMKNMSQITAPSDPLDFKNEIITGLAGKYYNIRGYGDFFNEYLNATDLSTGIYPNVNNQNPASPGYSGVYEAPVPGANFDATTGLDQPNSTTEKAYVASAFYQHSITFTPQWNFIYSGRADLLYDDLSDSIPTPGVDDGVHDTTTQVLGTGDASITYKPVSWATPYLTFDYNQSTAGNDGGGVDTYTNGGQSADYHYQNFLYEGGVKFSLLNNKLFTVVDGYYQNHNTSTGLGATSLIRDVGAEISTTFQPDKHFSIILNESYISATVVNPGSEFTGNVYDAFSTNSVGVAGTGVGSPNFTAQGGGVGDYREAGIPSWLFTGVASYKLDCGVGVSMSYEVTSPIITSEIANVTIPWQYELDESVFYEHKGFSARITFFNVTDQTNFSTGGYISSSGNDLITVKEPFHMEGTLGFKF